jgi:hypothetical protein
VTSPIHLEDLVTGAEIGRRLGFSTQRVHQLAGTVGFPVPLGRVGNSVVWRWADVEPWARRRGMNARTAGQLRQGVLTAVSTDGKLVFTTDEAEPGVIHVHKIDRRNGTMGERLGSAIAWAGTPIVELRPHESGVTVVGGRYEGEITENTKGNWTLSSSRDR